MPMNKALGAIVLLLTAAGAIYGEAPELRNVMPNSWRKITRLPANEEAAFIQNNMQIIESMFDKTEGLSYRVINNSFTREALAGQDVRVYMEQAGRDLFYRIIIAESRPANYDKWNEKFLQGLVYNLNGENIILAFNMYNYLEVARADGRRYSSIDIVSGGDRAKAVTLSYVYCPRVGGGDEQGVYYEVKGQPCGKTYLLYFRMEDVTSGMEFYDNRGVFYPGIPRISVEASDCLIDGNSPLRYGIQSAFDGDPATSYVENTEDDLMVIRILVGDSRKLAIINGYAQNQTLYYANNRVKKLIWPVEIELADNTLDYQFVQIPHGQEIGVSAIYKGNSYNDTCIAELNLKGENGWLFGDIADE